MYQTDEFSGWLAGLRDFRAKAAVSLRIKRIEHGDFGDSKFVGESVYELRVDVGKGYRAYFTNKNGCIVFLLNGGSKSTQNKDIEKAKRLAKEV